MPHGGASLDGKPHGSRSRQGGRPRATWPPASAWCRTRAGRPSRPTITSTTSTRQEHAPTCGASRRAARARRARSRLVTRSPGRKRGPALPVFTSITTSTSSWRQTRSSSPSAVWIRLPRMCHPRRVTARAATLSPAEPRSSPARHARKEPGKSRASTATRSRRAWRARSPPREPLPRPRRIRRAPPVTLAPFERAGPRAALAASPSPSRPGRIVAHLATRRGARVGSVSRGKRRQ